MKKDYAAGDGPTISAGGNPLIIPVFVPHLGCPHQCVFCDQRSITGVAVPPDAEMVAAMIRERLAAGKSPGKRQVQVAFYGGSFTGLPEEYQQELLKSVQPFIKGGAVAGIRISTRPDCISPEGLEFLRAYGVQVIELGAQSMDDVVLRRSGRGHTSGQIISACRLVRRNGLVCGIQLMVGLPGEQRRSLFRGAERVAVEQPDFVRIYPVLVVRGTPLESLYRAGKYQPLSLNRAVAYCAGMKRIFDAHGIPVIRMGLQPDTSLRENVLAGPFHPAFGELVYSRIFFNRLRKALSDARRFRGRKILLINPADQSVFRGSGNRNLLRLRALDLLDNVDFRFTSDQPRGKFTIESLGVSDIT